VLESHLIFNGMTMNRQDVLDANLRISPFYVVKVENVDGLWDAELSDETHPIPQAVGTMSGDTFTRGKTLTFSGYVEGLNLSYLRTGQRDLQQCLVDRLFHQFRFRLWNEEEVYLNMRTKQDLSMPESQRDLRFRRTFVFSLYADDPRTRRVSDDALYPAFQSSMA
jgi:hypothetical protein